MKSNSNLEFRKIKSLFFLYEINENGTILRNVKSKKQIKIKLDFHHSEKGYYTAFVNIKGKVHRVTIHKVVAECWLGDIPDGYEVDHKDRNSHNNHYTNLRYVTHSEQMLNRELGEHIIAQTTENCFMYTMGKVAKPVQILGNGKDITFASKSICAHWLSMYYKDKEKPSEHYRAKLKKKRSHIYDFDIIYLKAETGRTNSTE